MSDFIYSKDSDNIVSIIWDVKDKNMNVLTLGGLEDLKTCIDKALDDETAKGIIVSSNKKDFAGGMDLNVLQSMMSGSKTDFSEMAFEIIMDLHNVLRKLELAGRNLNMRKPSKPVVWASSGLSAGIGTEIALACHYRIATDDPKTKIGLPEILVGLFPFGGGTTRVMRMLGAMAASNILFEGKLLPAKAAKSSGLINEVCNPSELISKAKQWILSASQNETIKPWDLKGYKVPGGPPYHPSGFLTFVGAAAMVHAKTKGVYPAPKALMAAAYEGLLVPFETALKIEARWAVKLLNEPSTFNMINTLFVNKTALDKGISRPENIKNQKTNRLGVLGAGMMGSGIAYVSALANIDVILIDSTYEKATEGKSKVKSILEEGIRRKKTSSEQMDSVLSRITATDDYTLLKDVDLVIEAVFEDTELKSKVTKFAEANTQENTIIATNTSTLPISDLAKASKNSSNFIGIHFFSPVNKMNLVEIIRGKDTQDLAVGKALNYVMQIKKTPIVVNDARFFYANRCIIPYINEGVKMVSEGIEPALIENGAKLLGMPVGPLQLIDETSIDLANQIAIATKAALGKGYQEEASDEIVTFMVKNNRLGRKVNAGFYDYNNKGQRQNLWRGLQPKWPLKQTQPNVEEIKNRLGLIQALEAVRALEEGVLTDVREGDVGAILGWGCIPWAGGPFGWLDIVGIETIIKICKKFSINFGPRFTPPKLLETMAKTNSKFY